MPPLILQYLRIRQNIKKAPNARKVTVVVLLNLPPISNAALGASRCTYLASFNIPVSCIMLAHIIFSIQLTQ
jgi:hypothetical protein